MTLTLLGLARGQAGWLLRRSIGHLTISTACQHLSSTILALNWPSHCVHAIINMRLLSYFTALLCTSAVALSVATTKSDKLARFQSLSRSTPIDLDDSTYNELTSAPRDYHVAVMLTATDARFGCALCREFQPEWDLIAKSWNKGKAVDINLIFGTLDFTNGKETFRQVC